MESPTNLRVEHLTEAIGLTVPRPRLSWWLPPGAREQQAYQLRINGWDSGRIDSRQSVLVPYDGPPLRSRELVTWTVRVWTYAGVSDWAEPGAFELGLLNEDDWMARWIEPKESDEERSRTPRPAYFLRGSFVVDGDVHRARLYATAHGVYECFVNGRRVGDHELTPGFTNYRTTLHVQTFDVTDLLVPGENVLGAILSDGWFRGQVGGVRATDWFGETVALLAQLELHSTDGDLLRFGTGPDWVLGGGPIRQADLMQGEIADLSADRPGWCSPGVPPVHWRPVVVAGHDLGRLRSSPAPPVRKVAEINPVAVTRGSDRRIMDFGQNVNGWVRIAGQGAPGTTLTLIHGEALDSDGDVTQDNLSVSDFGDRSITHTPEYANLALPFQTDRVSLANDGEFSYEPRHTTHGFRYVRVEGANGDEPGPDLTAVVVHTDLRRTGWFECSDERINQLHEAAVWSLPRQRMRHPDRLPDPGAHRMDRRLADLRADGGVPLRRRRVLGEVAPGPRAEQRADGEVNHCSRSHAGDRRPPRFGLARRARPVGGMPPFTCLGYLPTSGDHALLADQWPSMTAWVDYAARAAASGRHPRRRAVSRCPQPMRSSSGTPAGTSANGSSRKAPSTPTSVPAFAKPTTAISPPPTFTCRRADSRDIAGVLGRLASATRYGELAATTPERLGDRVPRRRRNPHDADTQATLRPGPHLRAHARRCVRVGAPLVELIRAAGTHLGTGFLATPLLLPVLADTRAPRRRLRAAVPGHRTLVACDGRPWRHHRLGSLGGVNADGMARRR